MTDPSFKVLAYEIKDFSHILKPQLKSQHISSGLNELVQVWFVRGQKKSACIHIAADLLSLVRWSRLLLLL